MTRTSAFLLLTFALALSCFAQSGSGKDEKSLRPQQEAAKARRAQRAPAFTVAREAAALAFVGQHHPELVDLLHQLKESDEEEYERVVRELFQTSERLAGVQERNPERYALELEQWKLRSRIQLLAARVSMTDSETLKEELRGALEKQAKVRLDLLHLEQRQLRNRLEKIDALAAELEKAQDKHVQRQFDQLTGAIKKTRQERTFAKPRKKSADQKNSEKQKPSKQ